MLIQYEHSTLLLIDIHLAVDQVTGKPNHPFIAGQRNC